MKHSEACDCPPCLREYRQRNLWIGSIFTVLAAVACVHVLAWIFQLAGGF